MSNKLDLEDFRCITCFVLINSYKYNGFKVEDTYRVEGNIINMLLMSWLLFRSMASGKVVVGFLVLVAIEGGTRERLK